LAAASELLHSEGTLSAPKIHIHMSGEKGIFANAYIIESQNGVVVIDSTLTVSESKALRSQLDSIGKSILAIILTHPHPDHVAGVTNLKRSPRIIKHDLIYRFCADEPSNLGQNASKC
jgi:glyoxylase-like metal-dependent hydrolase (beta-lactamase superfamily II)